ncbi:phenylalanine--tRNA ligase subunit alpha [Candidatus Uhrbacteria bacterium]|nr:phenylalanine--tRNA ligase subunit alpha [Candidatus Uhrbacteria bacterium]
MTFVDKLQALAQTANRAIKQAKTLDELQELETRFLGRKGELTSLLRGLAEVDEKERPALGSLANEVKVKIESQIVQARVGLSQGEMQEQLHAEAEDVTEPGTRPPEGHLHLVTQAMREITEIFSRVGFVRTRYPEVDWDWYAFEALNMPKDHPARDEWETFFIDAPPSAKMGKVVLTPHTSNAQVREMEQKKFPIRIINMAKCYRRQMDITHVPMFHQFEGLYVDKNVGITHLRGIFDYFVKQFFGPTRQTRLRPFHFRFTEPSFEIDVSCGICDGTTKLPNGEKCRTCKSGWLELGGSGMVHPNVLKAAGLDPEEYSGFAFGWGVERSYMMKEGMQLDDIRTLYKNDLRFLQQF